MTERVARPTARRGCRGDLLVAGGLLVLALLLTPVLAAEPVLGLVLCCGAVLVLATTLWPVGALVGYIGLAPLLAGLDRGVIVPNLRLNELLLLPVLAGLALAVLISWLREGRPAPHRLHRLDVAVVAVALTASVTTLLWMYARGLAPTSDDLFYALVPWKLVVIYAAVRLVLRDLRSTRQALTAIVLTAGLIGVIGVLQAMGTGPVIDVLGTVLPPGEGGYSLSGNRATSTLGNPIAYGDLMLYAATIAAALAVSLPDRAPLLWTAAAALAMSALASGQASILVGLVAAGTAFAVTTGTVRRLATAGAVLGAVALVVLEPVLRARLSSADPETGLPSSWTGRYGRLENLRQYVWPEVTADFNWLFGVRTAGRVPGRENWREWVYIESGYAWSLWTGGLLLLVAVLVLLGAAARTGRRLRSSADPVGRAMGATLVTVVWMLAVLMVFDPHLTFRGAGEVLFVLLALGANRELDAVEEGPAPGRGSGWTEAGRRRRGAHSWSSN